jgi:hypothetical protein
MHFCSYSHSAIEVLTGINATAGSPWPLLRAFYMRASLCSYQVTLVDADSFGFDGIEAGQDAETIVSVHQAWRCARDETAKPSARLQAWYNLLRVGEPVLPAEPWLLRCREDSSRFLILLRGTPQVIAPLYYIYVLSNMWQVEQGNLVVHAAAIVRKKAAFLFLGPSGSGKSTVAALSRKQGGRVLDEDQVLLQPIASGGFAASAWSEDGVSPSVPVRALFFLAQGEEDRLRPLPEVRVAHFLLDRHLDIIGRDLGDQLLVRALSNAAAVARQVPGFELCFRRTPDFWKLIDEQFPD